MTKKICIYGFQKIKINTNKLWMWWIMPADVGQEADNKKLHTS